MAQNIVIYFNGNFDFFFLCPLIMIRFLRNNEHSKPNALTGSSFYFNTDMLNLESNVNVKLKTAIFGK